MGDQPKRMGRPPRAGEAAPQRTFRATDQEWALVQDAAAAAGVPVREWIRAVVIAAATRPGPGEGA